MKSPIKFNRFGSCMCFVVTVLALSFSGCYSNPPPPPPPPPPEIIYVYTEVPVHLMPLSDHIISSVGGLAAMQVTTFYISDIITLRLDKIKQEFTVEGDKIVRTSDILDDSVRIEPTKHQGKLYDSQEGSILYVDFKTTKRNLVIPFIKQGTGPNEKYEIYYTGNATDRIIDVGVATYMVSYGGNERNETPYLQFMLTDRVREVLEL